uniref:UDENN domain-containing protein n=1 Tax=Heterorhabditis bacteriophora TaxID=37862 RepID=A0A1I7XBI3_HETBA
MLAKFTGKKVFFVALSWTNRRESTTERVIYFICPPNHGIFAPLYRVELDEVDDVPMMTESQSNKSQEVISFCFYLLYIIYRLSRSALATLNLRNVFKPEDPMQMSITSNVSLNMDASTFSAISWNEGDPMVASNTTFIVPPGVSIHFSILAFDLSFSLCTGHLHDTEDCDLMSIPTPKSIFNIDRDALRREEERILGTSVVLEESRMGIENLPIVEDDDLETPLVESKVPIIWKSSLPCEESEINDHNRQTIPISKSRELIFGVSTKSATDANDVVDLREEDC